MGELKTWIVSPHGSAFFSSDAIDWAYKELMRYKEYEELSMMMKRAAIAGRDDCPFTQQAKDHMKKWEYLAPWQQQLAESEGE